MYKIVGYETDYGDMYATYRRFLYFFWIQCGGYQCSKHYAEKNLKNIICPNYDITYYDNLGVKIERQ